MFVERQAADGQHNDERPKPGTTAKETKTGVSGEKGDALCFLLPFQLQVGRCPSSPSRPMAAAGAGAGAGAAAAEEDLTMHHLDPAKLKRGMLVVCVQQYVVMSTGNDHTRLRTLKTNKHSTVHNGVMAAEFYDATPGPRPIQKLTRTALQKIVEDQVSGLPMEITFHKMQTAKRAGQLQREAMEKAVAEALATAESGTVAKDAVDWRAAATAPAKRKRQRRANAEAAKVRTGELRKMIGCKVRMDTTRGADVHDGDAGGRAGHGRCGLGEDPRTCCRLAHVAERDCRRHALPSEEVGLAKRKVVKCVSGLSPAHLVHLAQPARRVPKRCV